MKLKSLLLSASVFVLLAMGACKKEEDKTTDETPKTTGIKALNKLKSPSRKKLKPLLAVGGAELQAVSAAPEVVAIASVPHVPKRKKVRRESAWA